MTAHPRAGIVDRFRLDGKVVVITGASSGLGVAFAVACAEAGANVVVAARRESRLQQTVADIVAQGVRGVAIAADVTSAEDCQRIVDATTEHFGRIDILVNNAGVEDHTPASRLSIDEFDHVLGVNLKACFVMAQAAMPRMPAGSSMINVASVLGLTTLDSPTTAYSASKAGLLGLTRSLARQWSGRKGIRVNALLPGFFPTEMTADLPDGLIEHRLVLGRFGDPSELATALVFLASDASSYMTGSELVVDGGLLLT
ncbi:glucose 1-dehydrogenase [Mycobacterium syngnathidarum]